MARSTATAFFGIAMTALTVRLMSCISLDLSPSLQLLFIFQIPKSHERVSEVCVHASMRAQMRALCLIVTNYNSTVWDDGEMLQTTIYANTKRLPRNLTLTMRGGRF